MSVAIHLVGQLRKSVVFDSIIAYKVGCILSKAGPNLIQRVVRQRAVKFLRKSSKDLPVVSSKAGSRACNSSRLDSAIQVDKSTHLLHV